MAQSFDVKQAIESAFPNYKEDLSMLVAANSKNAPAAEGAPFGEGVRQALDYAVSVAQRFGFQTTVDPEGFYAYAEAGEGKEMLGVLGHLDVVPADDADAWNTPPFTLTEKDGLFFGRGVADDKGPMLASLYALKLLLDSGAVLTKRVRFIFCTDEESLWRGVKAYMAKEEHPTLGFTPDADFPLLYAEKGLVEYNLIAEDADSVELTGGSAFNAVAAKAAIPYDAAVEQAMKDLNYAYENKGGKLTAIGKTVHAMECDQGVNAITRLCEALVKAGKTGSMLKFVTEKGNDPHGTNIFGDVSDSFSGKLMFNIGLADFVPGKQTIGIDIRFPVSYKKEKVDKALQDAGAVCGVKVEQFDYLRPLHIDVNTPLVQSLMRAYQEVTGDTKTEPISTGGATFARSMDNIVAFGALIPGSPKTEHQANECTVIEDLKTAMAVYIRAFELLATEGA